MGEERCWVGWDAGEERGVREGCGEEGAELRFGFVAADFSEDRGGLEVRELRGRPVD